jgi:GxxExxY protein
MVGIIIENRFNMNLPHNDLSEEIIGICYQVYNELGWGYREQYYEKAIIVGLETDGFSYTKQSITPIKFRNKIIGYNRYDIFVENTILIELKVGLKLIKKDYDQINEYLKQNNIENGLLILFSPTGVVPKRIFNRPNYKYRS